MALGRGCRGSRRPGGRSAEAPGFEAGDLDIQVADDRLVLRASKKVETKGDGGKVREFREQECYESVVLPPGIDKAKIEARYRNGMLTVTLPKTAEGKAKKIAVKAPESNSLVQ